MPQGSTAKDRKHSDPLCILDQELRGAGNHAYRSSPVFGSNAGKDSGCIHEQYIYKGVSAPAHMEDELINRGRAGLSRFERRTPTSVLGRWPAIDPAATCVFHFPQCGAALGAKGNSRAVR